MRIQTTERVFKVAEDRIGPSEIPAPLVTVAMSDKPCSSHATHHVLTQWKIHHGQSGHGVADMITSLCWGASKDDDHVSTMARDIVKTSNIGNVKSILHFQVM